MSFGRVHVDVYNRLCTFLMALQVCSAAFAASNTADLMHIQYCVAREGALWCIQSFVYFFHDTPSLVSGLSAPKHCRFDAHTVLCRSGGCTLMYIIVCVLFLRHSKSGQRLKRPKTLQIWRVYSTMSFGRVHVDVYNRSCTFFTSLQFWSATLAPSNIADLTRIQYCVVREGALWCI